MKAAVYYQTGPPDVLRYEDVPDPVLAPGGVLIEVEAISIEGGDTLNRARRRDDRRTPHIVGYQCAGTIVAVGDERDRPGRRPAGRRDDAAAVRTPSSSPSPRGRHVAGSRGRRHRRGRVRAGRVRHRRRLPLRVRPPAGRRDRPHPGGRRRRRHRRDPARQAGRRDRARDRVERRPARAARPSSASTTASTTRRRGWVDEVRTLTGGRGVDLVVDSVGGTILQGSVAVPRATGAAAITVGQRRAGRAAVRRRRRSACRTSRSPACSSAPRSRPPRVQAMIAGLVDDVAAGRLTGGRRPHVPARRGGRRARVHREPPGGRPRRPDPLGRSGVAGRSTGGVPEPRCAQPLPLVASVDDLAPLSRSPPAQRRGPHPGSSRRSLMCGKRVIKGAT